jgi:hypothetical protein
MSRCTRQYKDSRTAPQSTPTTSGLIPESAASNPPPPGAQGNLGKINEDLQDVTRIMTKNMEDLLWRGDSLDREFRRHSSLYVSLCLFCCSASCYKVHQKMGTILNVYGVCRNVGPLLVATVRIAQVSETGEEHQPRGDAEAVRSRGSDRVDAYRLYVVEVLLRQGEVKTEEVERTNIRTRRSCFSS